MLDAMMDRVFPAAWPEDLRNLFVALLCALGLLSAIRAVRGGGGPAESGGGAASASGAQAASFKAFQREYLVVYLVIMLADWLQGTNMYTLYSGYGVSVSTLFLTGFSSSLVFGTFVGLLVDEYGRRRACVLFCVLEVVINLLEHVPSMGLLLLGRVLGGISTSLLFSAFESWMVAEHRKRGYPEAWLAGTFSLAAAGNGFVAVFAGLLAQVAADYRGDIGPFQLAIALTVLALGFVLRWPENYGAAGDAQSSSVAASGATFTFVFMWVPALIGKYPYAGDLPTGLVFASFMVAITLGGVVYGLAVGDGAAALLAGSDAVERFSLLVLLAAAAAMAVPTLGADAAVAPQASPLATFPATVAAFLLLEVCVGCFNGCAATMRARYIPDAVQGAVMNLSRVPLNVLVVAGTTMADHAPAQVAFGAVAATFLLGALLQGLLVAQLAPPKKQAKKAKKGDAAPPTPRRSSRLAKKQE
ncbi:sugar transporter [Aureococcus anophagefferens]|nr:sugar transporter [Aureococcus anophagefferens]